jgi:hypothetical protein
MSESDIHVEKIRFFDEEFEEIEEQTDDIDEWVLDAVEKGLDQEADE